MDILVATTLLTVRTDEEKERLYWLLPALQEAMDASVHGTGEALFHGIRTELDKVELRVDSKTADEVKAWLSNVRVPFDLRADQKEEIADYCVPSATAIVEANDAGLPHNRRATFWADLISIFGRELIIALDKLPRRQPMPWDVEDDVMKTLLM
jgi:hypothetical protein